MARGKAAWGIEVGEYAVKAIRLERQGELVAVSDFAEYRHKKPLSTPEIDRDEMIRLTLGQLSSQKSIENDMVVMSVSGGLPRFAKLPPADKKAIPKLIEFEAQQQIPFPIDEVEWDAKLFEADDSPEVEVGIFAVKKADIDHQLAIWSEYGLAPKEVTLGPVAVFNAVFFDRVVGQSQKPFVVLDIGTKSSDLIVVDGHTCWIRTFPIGGSDFTEAIAEAFKLPYSKAERLKQESATSKYAKQIMQAMRPVFGDLLEDVQKSIRFYENQHRGVRIETVLGVGSTFKIPGLRKFLGQQLGLNVARFDEFRNLQVEGRVASDFASHGVSMATAYGLALQGLEEAEIDVNLAPSEILRSQAWSSKNKWFVAAAGVALLASGMMFVPSLRAQGTMKAATVAGKAEVDRTVSLAERHKNEISRISNEANIGFKAANFEQLLEDREIWPHLIHDVMNAVASAGPQPELLSTDLQQIRSVDPKDRRMIMLEDLQGFYTGDGKDRTIDVDLIVAFSHGDTRSFLNDTIGEYINGLAAAGERAGVPYVVVENSYSSNPDDLVSVTHDGETRSLAGLVGERKSTSGKADDGGRPGRAAGRATGRGGMAGGGSAGGMSASGGGPGKKRGNVNVFNPNAGLGMSSSSGEKAASSSGRGGFGSAPGGESGSFSRSNKAKRPRGAGSGAFNLETDAPIPGEPQLFSKGDVFKVGRVTFTIKILPETPTGTGG